MQLFITTTGTQDPVILADLGYRELDHPLTDYELTSEFTYEDLINSQDFIDAIDNGYLTVKNLNNDTLTVNDFILGIFGTQYLYQASEDISSTCSLNFQNKINYTTPSLPEGEYRIFFYAEGRISNSSQEFIISGFVDNTEYCSFHGNDISQQPMMGYSGIVKLHLTEGTHNISIKFKSSHNTKTSYIRKARVEIWRVG